MKKTLYDMPENYLNRELSWLAFNERVLEEAENENNLLFERMKFLSIFSSNLDEFIMVRVSTLYDQVRVGYRKKDLSGMTASMQLKEIHHRIRGLKKRQYRLYNRKIKKELKREGLQIRKPGHLAGTERDWLEDYYLREIEPVLTPMVIDRERSFPLIRSRDLCLGVLLRLPGKEENSPHDLALVPVPSILPRVIRLPGGKTDPVRVILLEDVIEMHLPLLFPDCRIRCSGAFRVIRNADLALVKEEAGDLLHEIEKQLKERERGEVIRLEYDSRMEPSLIRRLKKSLLLSKKRIHGVSGSPDLCFLAECYRIKGFSHLKEKPYQPRLAAGLGTGRDMFEQIRQRDILLHHPYDSFEPVVEWIRQAASDPDVLAIKQTLYRVSGKSPVIAELEKAARLGKQVTALVEIKARFDEKQNINWARRLERAGVHVLYGPADLKVHCKVTLVVRREPSGIRRYVHLATGNYNEKTACKYTDIGIFTAREEYGRDASALFNMLSGCTVPKTWNCYVAAPREMRDWFLDRIRQETISALLGKKAQIIAKCKSLCDREIIAALYEASAAGVRIDLIIRGICCLIPGREGLSENIHVRSILGRFLEHARIYYFYGDGEEELFLGSADLMPRNLDRRVEILFPLKETSCRERVLRILKTQIESTEKAWDLTPEGIYRHPADQGANGREAQEIFMDPDFTAGGE